MTVIFVGNTSVELTRFCFSASNLGNVCFLKNRAKTLLFPQSENCDGNTYSEAVNAGICLKISPLPS